MFPGIIKRTGTVVCTADIPIGKHMQVIRIDSGYDDKSLPAEVRKSLQIDHSPHLSNKTRQLKIADKICNVQDVGQNPPAKWSQARRVEYLAWTEQVVRGCRGVNPSLERVYDREIERSKKILGVQCEAG